MEQQFSFVRLERFDHFRPSFNRVAGAGLVTTGLGLCVGVAFISEILVLLEKDAQLRGLRERAERSPT